jgi:hypothetical protein
MQQANASDSLQYVTFQVKSSPPVPFFFIHDYHGALQKNVR